MAIDFETAIAHQICAVAVVSVKRQILTSSTSKGKSL